MTARPTYIIAEAGVNHNGSTDLAKQLIEIAAEAGADAVKFQTFKAERLVTPSAATANYQRAATGATTQFDLLKRLELSPSAHHLLREHATKCKIEFLSTAFDTESLAFLYTLDLPLFKIPSGEITNYPLLVATAKLHKPVVVSTGMATMDDVAACVDVLLNGGVKASQMTLLHCNTQYPTPMEDVNLSAMLTLARHFPDIAIGYSDHTRGIEVPIGAVALGATLIEKHFTIARGLDGPDHAASLEPAELKSMVSAIRNIELASGDGIKQPTPSERDNISVARKSIVAARTITAGEPFSEENLTTMRPATGRSPMDWPKLLGQVANRDYETYEQID